MYNPETSGSLGASGAVSDGLLDLPPLSHKRRLQQRQQMSQQTLDVQNYLGVSQFFAHCSQVVSASTSDIHMYLKQAEGLPEHNMMQTAVHNAQDQSCDDIVGVSSIPTQMLSAQPCPAPPAQCLLHCLSGLQIRLQGMAHLHRVTHALAGMNQQSVRMALGPQPQYPFLKPLQSKTKESSPVQLTEQVDGVCVWCWYQQYKQQSFTHLPVNQACVTGCIRCKSAYEGLKMYRLYPYLHSKEAQQNVDICHYLPDSIGQRSIRLGLTGVTGNRFMALVWCRRVGEDYVLAAQTEVQTNPVMRNYDTKHTGASPLCIKTGPKQGFFWRTEVPMSWGNHTNTSILPGLAELTPLPLISRDTIDENLTEEEVEEQMLLYPTDNAPYVYKIALYSLKDAAKVSDSDFVASINVRMDSLVYTAARQLETECLHKHGDCCQQWGSYRGIRENVDLSDLLLDRQQPEWCRESKCIHARKQYREMRREQIQTLFSDDPAEDTFVFDYYQENTNEEQEDTEYPALQSVPGNAGQQTHNQVHAEISQETDKNHQLIEIKEQRQILQKEQSHASKLKLNTRKRSREVFLKDLRLRKEQAMKDDVHTVRVHIPQPIDNAEELERVAKVVVESHTCTDESKAYVLPALPSIICEWEEPLLHAAHRHGDLDEQLFVHEEEAQIALLQEEEERQRRERKEAFEYKVEMRKLQKLKEKEEIRQRELAAEQKRMEFIEELQLVRDNMKIVESKQEMERVAREQELSAAAERRVIAQKEREARALKRKEDEQKKREQQQLVLNEDAARRREEREAAVARTLATLAADSDDEDGVDGEIDTALAPKTASAEITVGGLNGGMLVRAIQAKRFRRKRDKRERELYNRRLEEDKLQASRELADQRLSQERENNERALTEARISREEGREWLVGLLESKSQEQNAAMAQHAQLQRSFLIQQQNQQEQESKRQQHALEVHQLDTKRQMEHDRDVQKQKERQHHQDVLQQAAALETQVGVSSGTTSTTHTHLGGAMMSGHMQPTSSAHVTNASHMSIIPSNIYLRITGLAHVLAMRIYNSVKHSVLSGNLDIHLVTPTFLQAIYRWVSRECVQTVTCSRPCGCLFQPNEDKTKFALQSNSQHSIHRGFHEHRSVNSTFLTALVSELADGQIAQEYERAQERQRELQSDEEQNVVGKTGLFSVQTTQQFAQLSRLLQDTAHTKSPHVTVPVQTANLVQLAVTQPSVCLLCEGIQGETALSSSTVVSVRLVHRFSPYGQLAGVAVQHPAQYLQNKLIDYNVEGVNIRSLQQLPDIDTQGVQLGTTFVSQNSNETASTVSQLGSFVNEEEVPTSFVNLDLMVNRSGAVELSLHSDYTAVAPLPCTVTMSRKPITNDSSLTANTWQDNEDSLFKLASQYILSAYEKADEKQRSLLIASSNKSQVVRVLSAKPSNANSSTQEQMVPASMNDLITTGTDAQCILDEQENSAISSNANETLVGAWRFPLTPHSDITRLDVNTANSALMELKARLGVDNALVFITYEVVASRSIDCQLRVACTSTPILVSELCTVSNKVNGITTVSTGVSLPFSIPVSSQTAVLQLVTVPKMQISTSNWMSNIPQICMHVNEMVTNPVSLCHAESNVELRDHNLCHQRTQERKNDSIIPLGHICINTSIQNAHVDTLLKQTDYDEQDHTRLNPLLSPVYPQARDFVSWLGVPKDYKGPHANVFKQSLPVVYHNQNKVETVDSFSCTSQCLQLGRIDKQNRLSSHLVVIFNAELACAQQGVTKLQAIVRGKQQRSLHEAIPKTFTATVTLQAQSPVSPRVLPMFCAALLQRSSKQGRWDVVSRSDVHPVSKDRNSNSKNIIPLTFSNLKHTHDTSTFLIVLLYNDTVGARIDTNVTTTIPSAVLQAIQNNIQSNHSHFQVTHYALHHFSSAQLLLQKQMSVHADLQGGSSLFQPSSVTGMITVSDVNSEHSSIPAPIVPPALATPQSIPPPPYNYLFPGSSEDLQRTAPCVHSSTQSRLRFVIPQGKLPADAEQALVVQWQREGNSWARVETIITPAKLPLYVSTVLSTINELCLQLYLEKNKEISLFAQGRPINQTFPCSVNMTVLDEHLVFAIIEGAYKVSPPVIVTGNTVLTGYLYKYGVTPSMMLSEQQDFLNHQIQSNSVWEQLAEQVSEENMAVLRTSVNVVDPVLFDAGWGWVQQLVHHKNMKSRISVELQSGHTTTKVTASSGHSVIYEQLPSVSAVSPTLAFYCQKKYVSQSSAHAPVKMYKAEEMSKYKVFAHPYVFQYPVVLPKDTVEIAMYDNKHLNQVGGVKVKENQIGALCNVEVMEAKAVVKKAYKNDDDDHEDAHMYFSQSTKAVGVPKNSPAMTHNVVEVDNLGKQSQVLLIPYNDIETDAMLIYMLLRQVLEEAGVEYKPVTQADRDRKIATQKYREEKLLRQQEEEEAQRRCKEEEELRQQAEKLRQEELKLVEDMELQKKFTTENSDNDTTTSTDIIPTNLVVNNDTITIPLQRIQTPTQSIISSKEIVAPIRDNTLQEIYSNMALYYKHDLLVQKSVEMKQERQKTEQEEAQDEQEEAQGEQVEVQDEQVEVQGEQEQSHPVADNMDSSMNSLTTENAHLGPDQTDQKSNPSSNEEQYNIQNFEQLSDIHDSSTPATLPDAPVVSSNNSDMDELLFLQDQVRREQEQRDELERLEHEQKLKEFERQEIERLLEVERQEYEIMLKIQQQEQQQILLQDKEDRTRRQLNLEPVLPSSPPPTAQTPQQHQDILSEHEQIEAAQALFSQSLLHQQEQELPVSTTSSDEHTSFIDSYVEDQQPQHPLPPTITLVKHAKPTADLITKEEIHLKRQDALMQRIIEDDKDSPDEFGF